MCVFRGIISPCLIPSGWPLKNYVYLMQLVIMELETGNKLFSFNFTLSVSKFTSVSNLFYSNYGYFASCDQSNCSNFFSRHIVILLIFGRLNFAQNIYYFYSQKFVAFQSGYSYTSVFLYNLTKITKLNFISLLCFYSQL